MKQNNNNTFLDKPACYKLADPKRGRGQTCAVATLACTYFLSMWFTCQANMRVGSRWGLGRNWRGGLFITLQMFMRAATDTELNKRN